MENYNRNLEDIQQTNIFKAFGHDNGGTEKKDRYNWPDLDEVGRFVMINKKYLDIDLRYQREASLKKVRYIARNFSWAICGALIVVEDDKEGKLLVVDGGHRLRAALLRGDIQEMPCIVFDRNGISEEARIFFETQTVKTNMKSFDRHKAGLCALKHIAIEAQELVERHGYDFSSNSGGDFKTSAIATIYNLINRNAHIADTTFEIMAKVAQGASIKNSELKGLFYLLSVNPRIDFFTFPLKNMADAGIETIQGDISRWRNATGRGGEKQFALGMLGIINKGQSKNKVIVPN